MGGGSGGFLEDASIVQPKEIQVEMRDYQLRGLRWLVGMHRCGVNAILADEMGLGKTLQTIAFLAHLKFVEGVHGPHLVIVSAVGAVILDDRAQALLPTEHARDQAALVRP